jgi:hypothetical protein
VLRPPACLFDLEHADAADGGIARTLGAPNAKNMSEAPLTKSSALG